MQHNNDALNINQLSTEILQQITATQAWHYRIIPFKYTSTELYCYINEVSMGTGLEDELELLFGKTVHLSPLETTAVQEYLGRYYRRPSSSNKPPKTQTKAGKDFLENLIQEAKELGSSDIHLEPYENNCRVRFRIDGILVERNLLAKEDYPSLVNKVKIKANLDIAEKRLPQDGRIFFIQSNQKFDIRVSTLPTLHGEKIVMRLLSSNDTDIDIEQLGFREEDLAAYMDGVRRPNGIVLISGPTGSGKTTTLYATLSLLNDAETNILTIEDPIEYTLEGINQVQLKESIGLNFASVMRTFLRQDPDIMMVGEIRDVETALMAIRAALTGHRVFSTIHTSYAWGIVARLVDMGIPAYLIADTLNAAVAQRLVRVLCRHCKIQKPFDKTLLPRHFSLPYTVTTCAYPIGCEDCHYTGYKGRKAVYEVIPIDEELRDRIKQQDLNVHELLKAKGIVSLSQNAFDLFAQGLTSAKEIYPILAGTRGA